MLLETVDNFIERVKGLNVAVIGETITDEFEFVSYEGQSMKSICPVFKTTGRHEIQEGGAAAIANHLRDFVKKVDLFSNPAGEIVWCWSNPDLISSLQGVLVLDGLDPARLHDERDGVMKPMG